MENNNLLNDDEQFKELRHLLKEMPKMDAPPGFEANLMRAINSEKFATAKPGLWERITAFMKPIPSAVAVGAVAIVAVVLLVNQPGDEIMQKANTPLQQNEVAATQTEKSGQNQDKSPEFESKEQRKPVEKATPPPQKAYTANNYQPTDTKSGFTSERGSASDLPSTTAAVPAGVVAEDAKPESLKAKTKSFPKAGNVAAIQSANQIQKKLDSLKNQNRDTNIKN
ncbi:hypothetical protein MASR1M107_24670 [Ignavibacteriales bacterium]